MNVTVTSLWFIPDELTWAKSGSDKTNFYNVTVSQIQLFHRRCHLFSSEFPCSVEAFEYEVRTQEALSSDFQFIMGILD